MINKIVGFIRGLSVINYTEAREDVQITLNPRGEQIIAPGLPANAEMVRAGGSWQGATRTGQAALTVLPTTTAGLSLANLYPDGGPWLIIEAFGSWEAVVDVTQTDVTAIFAMLNDHADTLPSAGTDEATTVIRSLSGRPSYDGPNVIKRGGTVVDAGWFPHNTSGQMAPAAAGANWKVNEVQCAGLYQVPPGGAFNVQAVKAAAAAAAQQFFFVRWHEAPGWLSRV